MLNAMPSHLSPLSTDSSISNQYYQQPNYQQSHHLLPHNSILEKDNNDFVLIKVTFHFFLCCLNFHFLHIFRLFQWPPNAIKIATNRFEIISKLIIKKKISKNVSHISLSLSLNNSYGSHVVVQLTRLMIRTKAEWLWRSVSITIAKEPKPKRLCTKCQP